MERPLIIATRPATGARLAPANRYALFAKSPLTRIFGESYAGGFVAPAVSATGYDAIVLQGAAHEPVHPEIRPEAPAFHDASAFWGLDLYAAEEALEKDVGVDGAKGIVIGPAGENQVGFAAVGNDQGHAAGRTGMGAVLGAKRVKGIVFHGDRSRALFDPEGIAD